MKNDHKSVDKFQYTNYTKLHVSISGKKIHFSDKLSEVTDITFPTEKEAYEVYALIENAVNELKKNIFRCKL